MDEHFIRVSRTARYVTLGSAGPSAAELWLVCHGYGQLAGRFAAAFAPLVDDVRLVVAPEGLSRFYVDRSQQRVMGASWMTREDRLHEIEDYLGYLDAVYAEVRSAVGRDVPVTAFGFSQGVATATRWAARTRAPLRRLGVWGGSLPPELDLAVFRGRRITAVCGERDELITPKVRRADEERWRAAGVPVEVRLFGGGHEMPADVLADVVRG